MDYEKIGNGLQVTDIGTSALHMVGYLGKDYSSAEISPDECCPACRKKGLIQPLRTHRINFEESIVLCNNPQCIYPLGFEPLSNIIIPIDPKGSSRKRKFFNTSLVTPSFEPHLKSTRSNNVIDTKQTLVPKCHGNNPFETHLGQPDFSKAHQPDVCSTAESVEKQMGLEMAATENLPGMSIVQTQLLSGSESGSSMSQILPQDKQSLPEQLWLQWRNAHALCWLDCILSALVHLETLKKMHSESISENISVIQRLFTEFNEAIALVNNCERGENTSEVPSDIVSKAESHLNEIRNIIFVQLQPKLKCKLGEEESPLFAFPLLLHTDSKIENLFLHSFSWNLECSQCGYRVCDRHQKTLTTFTNIIPEWHPLNAVHIAPCNNCNHKSQRRKMVLENVPPVFMVHFVEGLQHNNLRAYSFQFQDDSYQIKAIIQYQKKEKHFITWVLNSDETWLECDDLKGLYCRRHKSFGVPPAEIHIVIWEREAQQMTSDRDLQLQSEGAMNIPLLRGQPKSPVKNHHDKPVEITPLICHSADKLNAYTNKAETLDSNNKSSLLWDDDDIITLNLVSVPLDSEGKPLEDSHIVQNNLLAKADTSQLQGGELNMPPLTSEESISLNKCITPEHSTISLHQTQPSNASNLFIMPTIILNTSSNLPATPVQGAEPEVNLVPVKDSSLVNPQNEACKTKSGNSWQRALNTAEHRIETAANCHVSTSSNSSQPHHKNGTKSAAPSWLKSLHGKCTFVPKDASTFKKEESSQKFIKKETSSLLGRHANHFQGFQAKSSRKLVGKVTGLGSSPMILPPSSTTSVSKLAIEKHVNVGSEGTVAKRPGSWVISGKQIQPSQNCNENKNFVSVENSTSDFDKTHQLRLELLQKLKAKKEKLATLDKVAKGQDRKKRSTKKIKKNESQLGSQNGDDPLQRLLNELQHQIDVEDNKSVHSPITNMSQCSSSTHEDILSELLSPSTTIASLEIPHEEECRYLEMGGGSPESPTANQKPDEKQITNHEHNFYSPVKTNGGENQTDLSPMKKLYFDSPVKQDILDDLFSSSMLNSITNGAEDFDHFDETLLTC